RGDLEARDPPAPPRPWGLLPRDEPRAAPFELREIRAMPSAQDLDGDRVGGAPALAVDHPGRDERGLSGEELGGQGGLDAHSTDRLLGEHPRHDDQAEQHRDEEIEEIVPGVDGGESEAERGAEAPPAVARGPERASRPREPPPDPTPRCHAGVTGDGSPGGGWLAWPRRTLWPTRDGWWCLGAALGLGFAAINTGNNLFYLLVSMLLGLIIRSEERRVGNGCRE